jgi:hypothetical protein
MHPPECMQANLFGGLPWSPSAPEPVNRAAISLRWSALRRSFNPPRRFAFFCQVLAHFTACLSLAVERLSNGGRTAHLAEQQDLDLEVTGLVRHSQQVANADIACRLRWLAVGMNSTEFTGTGCECSRFEKSGCPKPLVHAYGSHGLFTKLMAHRRVQQGMIIRPLV